MHVGMHSKSLLLSSFFWNLPFKPSSFKQNGTYFRNQLLFTVIPSIRPFVMVSKSCVVRSAWFSCFGLHIGAPQMRQFFSVFDDTNIPKKKKNRKRLLFCVCYVFRHLLFALNKRLNESNYPQESR